MEEDKNKSTESKPSDQKNSTEEPEVKGILGHKGKKQRKSVNWDWKSLEENEIQNKLHPVTMKITEPKTPYTPYEEGDDEYFEKLNAVNATKPTEDVLAKVINTLEKIPEKEDECIEIEVVENDGTIVKKLVPKNSKENKEFRKKQKMAYHNEYAKAKEFMKNHPDEEKDEELIEKTMENTLANKYVGLIENKKEKGAEK